MTRLVTFCAGLLLLCATAAMAQSRNSEEGSQSRNLVAEFKANLKPSLTLSQTTGPISIDGELDDRGWNDAARAVNFAEINPGDNVRPPVDVEAWTTYDEDNIYFAFIVRDNPGSIRSTLSDRDAIWDDDYVGVLLDTYGDNAWVYFIASNPIGIQADTRIVNQGGEDASFDIVFHSDGKITDFGYQVEMAVPFRSLRFPSRDVQQWGLNFWITHPRQSRSQYSWASISRDEQCWICQFGTATGIRDVRPGRNFELLPAITGSQSAALRDSDNPGLGLNNDRVTAEPSLGIKYAITSNLTADVAVNPDFSQIEADAAQVDVNTTFALFFRERRPFFQEGSELFQTNVRTVYTRSINNPIAASKVTGRFGRTNVAYIGGVDADSPVILPFEESSEFAQAGRSVSNIIRVRQNIGSSSHLGGLVTDRRLTEDGGSGSTLGIDGRVRLSSKYTLEAQFVGSHTEEPDAPDLIESDVTFDGGKYTAAFDGESYSGFASYVSFERNARHWSFDLDYRAASPTFRADNGFITQNNLHQTFLWTEYTFFLDGIVERIEPNLVTGYWWNFDGVRKDQFVWVGLDLRLKAQTNAGFQWLIRSDERFQGIDFRKLWRLNGFVNSDFSDLVNLGGWFNIGRAIARNEDVPQFGDARDFELWGSIKPLQRLRIQPSFIFSSMYDPDTGDELFKGYILRARTNLQFTKHLFLRLVTQYNDFSDRFELDPLITYKINPFTAFYVGSTHDFDTFDDPHGVRQSERQVFFKFQYLVRM